SARGVSDEHGAGGAAQLAAGGRRLSESLPLCVPALGYPPGEPRGAAGGRLHPPLGTRPRSAPHQGAGQAGRQHPLHQSRSHRGEARPPPAGLPLRPRPGCARTVLTMRTLFITCDDVFYLPRFFSRVLRQWAPETAALVVLPPLRDFKTTVKRSYNLYGPWGFFKNSARYAARRAAGRLGAWGATCPTVARRGRGRGHRIPSPRPPPRPA